MSSTYRLLCLAHDPAIVLTDREFTNPGEALYAAAELRDQLAGEHRECDLILGRWSGGLIELACPGYSHCGNSPHQPKWTDVGWLRLLLAASNTVHSKASWLATALGQLHNVRRCWTFDRLLRLRHQLGLEHGGESP